MVIKSIQIFKGIIFITNNLLQFRGEVHHHIIGWVALENVVQATVIEFILDCRL